MGTRALIAVAEFEKLPDDGNLHELDEGELVVMPPPGFEHGIIQAAVGENLRQAARSGCGGMVTTESGFRFAPDVIQGSDVASVRREGTSVLLADIVNSLPISQSNPFFGR